MKRTDFQIESAPPRVMMKHGDDALELPALWLREHCQDETHVDPCTQQRLFNPHQMSEDITLTRARRDDGDHVSLSFSDGYSGNYSLSSLAADFDPRDGCPEPLPWTADMHRRQVTFDWPALSARPALLSATEAFLRYGFLILRRVPTEAEAILDVARRFGHLRETNFGRYFEVYSRPQSNDLAYRSVPLGPHTDNPYREAVPGIQLLHCLINETSGGLSTLVDSLSVCTRLKQEDPAGFAALCNTPVRFRFIDDTDELISRRPIISRDSAGNVTGVHYSPRLDYLPLLPDRQLKQFHRARRRLAEMFVDPQFEMRFPLRAGELMFFDNNRVLHGRTAFDPNEGRRHVQGCYIDSDGPRSLFRKLSAASGPEKE